MDRKSCQSGSHHLSTKLAFDNPPAPLSRLTCVDRQVHCSSSAWLTANPLLQNHLHMTDSFLTLLMPSRCKTRVSLPASYARSNLARSNALGPARQSPKSPVYSGGARLSFVSYSCFLRADMEAMSILDHACSTGGSEKEAEKEEAGGL